MKKPLSEFYENLKTIGLPVAHVEWEVGKVPNLPYIIYYQTGQTPWYADNNNYYGSKNVTVELYTDYKDEATESLLEAFFYAYNIPIQNIEETFWSEEHLYEVSYEILLF